MTHPGNCSWVDLLWVKAHRQAMKEVLRFWLNLGVPWWCTTMNVIHLQQCFNFCTIWTYLNLSIIYISIYIYIYIHCIYIFLYYFDLWCIHQLWQTASLHSPSLVPSRHRSEVGGFRIDAAPFLLEDPQLRNEVSHVWNARKHRSKHEVEKWWKMWNCWSFELCDIWSLVLAQLNFGGMAEGVSCVQLGSMDLPKYIASPKVEQFEKVPDPGGLLWSAELNC